MSKSSENALEKGHVPHTRVLETSPDEKLSEENRHYLTRVMRLRPGDRFCVTDGKGGEIEARLGEQAGYEVLARHRPDREPRLTVTVFAGLTKGDGFEFLIEKAVELGVRRIVPLLSQRCVVGGPSAGRLERWRKIAVSAMLQCGGCVQPEVEAPRKLGEIIPPEPGVAALVLEATGDSSAFADRPSANAIWLASGPEGGLTDEEIADLVRGGWKTARLGERRLRAETAPLAALALLLCR